jgi:ComF family protein
MALPNHSKRALRVNDLIPNLKSLIPDAVRAAANGLAAALLAPVCAVCNAILDEPLRGCVCMDCWGSVHLITPPVCDACGDPLPRPLQPCSHGERERIVDRARAAGEYDGVLREIIHALKYSGRRSLAAPLAAQMRTRGRELLDCADYAVPVPLHWRREYQRGFNQARELARHLGIPLVDALERRRHTRAQVELSADRRHANVEGAFAVRRSLLRRAPSIRGLKVLLVDDVSTTGATLDACAQTLKDAGASEILALTAARVVTKRHHIHS